MKKVRSDTEVSVLVEHGLQLVVLKLSVETGEEVTLALTPVEAKELIVSLQMGIDRLRAVRASTTGSFT